MKDLNSALDSHRKPAKPQFYQLIVVVNFNRPISYQRLIENRLIVNIPTTDPNFRILPRVKSLVVVIQLPPSVRRGHKTYRLQL